MTNYTVYRTIHVTAGESQSLEDYGCREHAVWTAPEEFVRVDPYKEMREMFAPTKEELDELFG